MIVFVVSTFWPDVDSGAAGTIDAISRAWVRQGHDVTVAWREMPSGMRTIDEFVRTPAYLLQQIRSHLLQHPDTELVIASQPYAARAFRALRPSFPRTLFVNRTHGWEERGFVSQSRFGWEPTPSWGRGMFAFPARLLRRRMCWQVAQAAHGVVAACGKDANWIREQYGLADWQVAAIPYGIDQAALPPPPNRSPDGPTRFIFSGTYCERKGSAVLEQVMPTIPAEYPDVELTLVVHDSAMEHIERVYRPTWGHRLTIRKWMPRPELLALYGNHDVLLFPSFFEGFGKVVIEALAMGCAVAGFDEGVLGDFQSSCCLTCPVGDVAAFDRMVRDIAGRRVDVRSLSSPAIQIGRGRTWDHTAAETIQFFQQLRDHYRAGMS